MSEGSHLQGANVPSDVNSAVDFSEPAELFSGRTRAAGTGYRRFASLQAAISFSIEDMPHQQLNSVAIETSDTRYTGQEIRALYVRPDFPRRAAAQ